MELILVSDFSPIVNEHLLLNQLFINGLEVFHLRKRDYTLQQMMDYIQAIPAVYHPKIVIHSHFQLLSYFDLKGVHFSKQYTLEHFKNESSEELWNLVCKKHISLSVHSLNDILKLENIDRTISVFSITENNNHVNALASSLKIFQIPKT